MTDWKEKEKAALEEGHHWAIQAGLQFDKTWTDRKQSFNLYRKGVLIASASTAWEYRDLAYALCPYDLSPKEEKASAPHCQNLADFRAEAREFITQSIAALSPETEDELLLAIADHPLCDWGLARSIFRQQQGAS